MIGNYKIRAFRPVQPDNRTGAWVTAYKKEKKTWGKKDCFGTEGRGSLKEDPPREFHKPHKSDPNVGEKRCVLGNNTKRKTKTNKGTRTGGENRDSNKRGGVGRRGGREKERVGEIDKGRKVP